MNRFVLSIGHVGAVFLSLLLAACVAEHPNREPRWQALFDGKTLDGWIPKIVGHPAGADPLETFRVRDGAIVISYHQYGGNMQSRWAHLFYKEPFKAYRLSMEYRFVGEETPNTPTRRTPVNSGVLYHAQSPHSMSLSQLFPISAEAQVLGYSPVPYRDGTPRKTASACGMGTVLSYQGREPQECFNSTELTRPNGQWVSLEIEVRPDGVVNTFVDGKLAATYDQLLLDTSDQRFPSQSMIDAQGGDRLLRGGYIALQSEGHPVEFRNIKILPLE